MNDENLRTRPDSLFSTIMGDVHFWIPLIVLLAGLLLLHELH
ncbi:MAG: translocated intimin receptor Tir [Acidobacteria bacterium]|nr:MAG: translocated intimin receptor Tir [Acidobacteriota bacterium]